MIEIISIEELKKGDIILCPGFDDDTLFMLTVKRITKDNLIIPTELGGMDYAPEDSNQIVRIGKDKIKPLIKYKTSEVF